MTASAPALTQRQSDERFMRAALRVGERFIGQTAPNPSVGCLIVRDGVIVGQGATQKGGRPHAETEALRQAGERARGATLYVTLEPCSHHGVTAPCVDAIIHAGVARVVGALQDPDPRVAGRGYELLLQAGIEVTKDICAPEALRAHRGHVLRVTQARPMLTLKLAQTKDGFAGAKMGEKRLIITGEEANHYVHMLRAQHDAIMVGVGTVRADNPSLTVRLLGMTQSPLRIIIDSHLTTPVSSELISSVAKVPSFILCGEGVDAARKAVFLHHGVRIAEVPRLSSGDVDLHKAMHFLAQQGITRVLCEGGPHLASALLDAGLVDDVLLLTAAHLEVHDGIAALSRTHRSVLQHPSLYHLRAHGHMGADIYDWYERA